MATGKASVSFVSSSDTCSSHQNRRSSTCLEVSQECSFFTEDYEKLYCTVGMVPSNQPMN